MKSLITILIVSLLGISLYAYSQTATEQANQDGKDFADALNNSKIKTLGQTVDPTTIPGYAGPNAPQEAHYGTGFSIESAGHAEASVNSDAQYINNAAATRPVFIIDQDTDPIFHNQDTIRDQAHGLTSSYSGCTALPVGTNVITTTTNESCTVTGFQPIINWSCTENITATCTNTDAGDFDPWPSGFMQHFGTAPYQELFNGFYRLGNTSDFRSGGCIVRTDTLKFNIPDVNLISYFAISSLYYDDWLDVYINNELVRRGIGPHQGTGLSGSYGCEHGSNYFLPNITNAKDKLVNGENLIQFVNRVGGGGGFMAQVWLARVKGCNASESSTFSCPSPETMTSGTLDNRVCIDAPSDPKTRIVDGVPVTLACWKYRNDLSRPDAVVYTEDASCQTHRDNGCVQNTAICDINNGSFCEQQTLGFECSSTAPARTVDLCGSTLVCPDGNCTDDFGQTPEDQTEAFKDAAVAMEVAQEIASSMDHGALTIFEGEAQRCKKTTLGFSDCCADSGWGLGIGLGSCKAEEKALGLAKEAGRTVYVGSYETGSFLDKRKYKAYCTFPSVIGRIVMEEGYNQLGKVMTPAKTPNCEGLTPAELELLDYSVMDFSELEAAALETGVNGTTPTGTDAAQKIKDRLSGGTPVGNGG